MNSTPDVSHDEEFIDTDPTLELDVLHVPDSTALRSLVDQYSERFNDEIREDLEATSIQSAPSLNRFRSLNDWNHPISPPDVAAQGQTTQTKPQHSAHDQQFEHYAEIMAIVRSYEKMLDEQFDLGITLKNYPETGSFRLLSISVYRSGSVTLLGTNKDHMPINVYDKIDNISFAIVPLKREKQSKSRHKISFFFHERPAA